MQVLNVLQKCNSPVKLIHWISVSADTILSVYHSSSIEITSTPHQPTDAFNSAMQKEVDKILQTCTNALKRLQSC